LADEQLKTNGGGVAESLVTGIHAEGTKLKALRKSRRCKVLMTMGHILSAMEYLVDHQKMLDNALRGWSNATTYYCLESKSIGMDLHN
jgi:hypothetical protein